MRVEQLGIEECMRLGECRLDCAGSWSRFGGGHAGTSQQFSDSREGRSESRNVFVGSRGFWMGSRRCRWVRREGPGHSRGCRHLRMRRSIEHGFERQGRTRQMGLYEGDERRWETHVGCLCRCLRVLEYC
jgi:hypothetical protein